MGVKGIRKFSREGGREGEGVTYLGFAEIRFPGRRRAGLIQLDLQFGSVFTYQHNFL